MELLSQTALEALQACGNSSVIKDASFQTIVNNSLTYVLDPSKPKQIPTDTDVDAALLKQLYPALMTFYLEAAKTDMGTDQMNLILDDCNFTQERKDYVIERYKINKQKIRVNLGLISNGHPHIVDVDWRLDYNLKNSELNKVMELKYTLALKTDQRAYDDREDVQFSCTREQLQDFVGKLKEAVKAVEIASQN